MQLLRRLAFLGIGLAWAATQSAQGATLYGIGPWPDGNVYTIDVATGQATLVGPSFMEVGASGLAFRDDGTWVVIDFKTDRELDVALDVYRRQVQLYAQMVARATGEPARAVLMRV